MRNRLILTTAIWLLPAALMAQRIPVHIPTSIPREPRTDPGEPQPAPVAQRLAYTRSRWSFESTNIASVVNAPGFGADAGPLGRNWSLTGSDLHLEYRTTDNWGPTLDLAGASFGNSVSSPVFPQPVLSELLTLEPGVRYHLAPISSRITPFLDLRANYMFANANYQALFGAGSAQQWVNGAKQSGGVGGIGGAGLETIITGPWSLLTEVSTVADRMGVTNLLSGPTTASHYWMHWTRLSLGVKYNRIIYHQLAERAIPQKLMPDAAVP